MLRGPKKVEILVTEKQRECLEQLIRRRSTPQYLAKRARLILDSVEGLSNSEISRRLPLDRPQVVTWRGRWIQRHPELVLVEQEHPEELEAAILSTLRDRPRPGTPPNSRCCRLWLSRVKIRPLAAARSATGPCVRVSLDEMTGIQALEHLHPTLPMKPGWIERREFEYVRHGTLSLIVGLKVATDKMVSSTMAPTRN